jgi:hypothetical protein
MEKTLSQNERIKEYMEWIWNKTNCQMPLQLCSWFSVESHQGHFSFLGLRRGHSYEEI